MKRSMLISGIIILLFCEILIGADTAKDTLSDQPRIDFTVAQDGSGDFSSVQAAIMAVPDFRKNGTVIMIRNGVYKEKLILPASKNFVRMIGEGPEKTILTHDDFASKKNCFGEEMGTTGSSSFFIFGNDFIAENMTFENSAGPVGQAVAVRIDGDRVKFVNCLFRGFQDTLYPHGNNSRQYYLNCTIEGSVDFIFGWSTAVFEDCTILCKDHGYITAASTEKETPFGFVFIHCRIIANAAPNSFYLGRPWRDYAKTVFIECELGPHIKPEGWHNWGQEEREKTAYYAEYKNSGPGFQPDQRVPWSHQLTETEAAMYTLKQILGDWDPKDP
jgi:pectinesterase